MRQRRKIITQVRENHKIITQDHHTGKRERRKMRWKTQDHHTGERDSKKTLYVLYSTILRENRIRDEPAGEVRCVEGLNCEVGAAL